MFSLIGFCFCQFGIKNFQFLKFVVFSFSIFLKIKRYFSFGISAKKIKKNIFDLVLNFSFYIFQKSKKSFKFLVLFFKVPKYLQFLSVLVCYWFLQVVRLTDNKTEECASLGGNGLTICDLFTFNAFFCYYSNVLLSILSSLTSMIYIVFQEIFSLIH